MAADLAVTTQNFKEEVLNSDVPVLVDFWAEWCAPCLSIGPSIEQLAEEYKGRAKVKKLDIMANQQIAEDYGVMSIPALLVFKDGHVVDQIVGAAKKDIIAQMIDRSITQVSQRTG